jgi:quercetin dioxygenase-like cupin family protein
LTDAKPAVTEIMKLRNLVDYQNGALVSRALVDEEGGTLTAFAFDEGQGLSEHTAPYEAVLLAVEGEVDIKISGRDFHLKEREMIVMPANKLHALKAVTKFKMILIMVRSGRGRHYS